MRGDVLTDEGKITLILKKYQNYQNVVQPWTDKFDMNNE